ncbi:MAG: nuclear transport factor 2 family protein [Armatimonadota bacterium]
MRTLNRTGLALAAGLLSLGVASAAQAQFGPTPPPRNPGEQLLEQGFQYGRMKGPKPGSGGTLTPPPSYRVPPTAVTGRYRLHPGGGYYYPGYPGYPYYPYQPGYVGGIYTPYGYVLIPGQQRDVYRSETVIIQGVPQPQGGYGAQPQQNERPPQRRETPREERPSSPSRGEGGFYLDRQPAAEGLTDALDDIRKAWLNGDFERLKARFEPAGKVGIFLKGDFKYAMDAPEFQRVIRDAMSQIDTLAFELDRPRSEEAGRVFVTGKHTFLNAEKERKETFISYGLLRVDGKWKIVEAGSSSEPITAHRHPAAEPEPKDE